MMYNVQLTTRMKRVAWIRTSRLDVDCTGYIAIAVQNITHHVIPRVITRFQCLIVERKTCLYDCLVLCTDFMTYVIVCNYSEISVVPPGT